MATYVGLEGMKYLSHFTPSPIAQADRARDNGLWSKASELYARALKRNPDSAPIWVQYAHMLKEQGDLEAAERAYYNAVARDPNQADTHRHLGHLLMRRNKLNQAEAHYLRAVALNPPAADFVWELEALGWSRFRLIELQRILLGNAAQEENTRMDFGPCAKILVLAERETVDQLKRGEGEPPRLRWSHDHNLLQFMHEALRAGHRVWVGPVHSDPSAAGSYSVAAVYPDWYQASKPISFDTIEPDIVVAVFPEALNVRAMFPRAKIIAIHAAIHWLEAPEVFTPEYVFDLLTAIKYNVDFIITQNRRMAEILAKFYRLLVRWPLEDRILIAPLGIVWEERRISIDRAVVRRQMGATEDDIVIINAGGVWRWTDVNSFLVAFGEFTTEHSDARMQFHLMGLVQENNHDHDSYIAETEEILNRFSHLVGRQIIVHRDWAAASRIVNAYTAASDIGLNVNQDSLENWQSHRVRSVNYMAYGMPVINTSGDLFSELDDGQHAFVARPGDIATYKEILHSIVYCKDNLARKREAMRMLCREYDTRRTYGEAIKKIICAPNREHRDYDLWGKCVIEHATDNRQTLVRRKNQTM